MPKDLFHQSLFHHLLFNQALLKKRKPLLPTPAAHKKILHDWASTIRDGSIYKQNDRRCSSLKPC